MLLGSESRQFVFFLPFCSIFILRLLDDFIHKNISIPILLVHGLICLILSKFWWTITLYDFTERAENLIITEDFLNPVIQRYFMFHGPWMNQTSFQWLFISAVILLIPYKILFRRFSES
jgi:hypothetical protein